MWTPHPGPVGAPRGAGWAGLTVEDLLALALLGVVGAGASCGLLAWAAGQLAGLAVHGDWPPVPAGEALRIAARLPGHLADPRGAWPAPARARLAGPVPFYAAAAGLLTAATAAAVAIGTALGAGGRAGRRRRRSGERDASPAWATRRQVRHLLLSRAQLRADAPGRVVLGHLDRPGRPGRRRMRSGPAVAVPARRSVMLVAPTQTGKTTRVVIPAVLRWHGPLLVTSVKTDVLRLTIHERARRGRVHVFDPTASTGLPPDRLARWNPLPGCLTYPGAERSAAWLVQAAGETRPVDNARFWESLGGKLLAPLLFAAAAADPGSGMRRVARWVDRREVAEVSDILGWLGDEDALDAWAASCAREDRQRDSVYATAEAILRAFASPSARAATGFTAADAAAGRVLDVAELIRRGDTLYLVAPAHEQDRLRPLFEALVQALLRAAQDAHAATGAPLDPPLLLMLDEAANIAPLRDLAGYAATGAGQGIQLCSVWQDLAQVQAIYGHKAPTVINGHTARMFLPGSADLATLEATSRLIGDHEQTRVALGTGPHGHRTVNTSTAETRAAPADYLRQLPADTAVLLSGRDPVLRLRTTAWYHDPALRERVDRAAAAAAHAAAHADPRTWTRRARPPPDPAGPSTETDEPLATPPPAAAS